MDGTPWSDDWREFLRLLTANDVEFPLVGGYAVALHGYPRATADLDLWIGLAPRNLERVMHVLREFGFDPGPDAARALATPGRILRMGRPPSRIELLTAPAGVEFPACRRRAVPRDLLGMSVPTISLDDLIANKRAAGRPKDLVDAAELERIRDARGG